MSSQTKIISRFRELGIKFPPEQSLDQMEQEYIKLKAELNSKTLKYQPYYLNGSLAGFEKLAKEDIQQIKNKSKQIYIYLLCFEQALDKKELSPNINFEFPNDLNKLALILLTQLDKIKTKAHENNLDNLIFADKLQQIIQELEDSELSLDENLASHLENITNWKQLDETLTKIEFSVDWKEFPEALMNLL